MLALEQVDAYDVPNLEELLTEDFGLANPAPLQRAICRIADGRSLGELKTHPHVIAGVGHITGKRYVPSVIALLAAIRCGKSKIAAAAAIRCALTCDDSRLTEGEMPRVAIVSIRRDQAKVVMDHLTGAIANSARLRARVVEVRLDRVILRHPSGRHVEIVVDAGRRAGGSLVARWMAAVIFDEATRMVGSEDGIVNLDDSMAAIAGRMLLCACANRWLIGSPWAPFGPMFELSRTAFEKPSPAAVVVRARGDWLNPSLWTPEAAEKLRAENPVAYKTDFLAEFADPETSLLSGEELEACVRKAPLDLPSQVHEGYQYAAEMDPATRLNAWTLCVAKKEGKKSIIVLARQWVPGPDGELSPAAVLRQIRDLLAPYGVTRVGTDQWRADSLREIAKDIGLTLVDFTASRESNNDGYLELATMVREKLVELPDERMLLSDLRRLVRKTTATGFKIDLPSTGDGRHCDYAPSVMRVVARQSKQPVKVDPRTEADRDQAAYRERLEKAVRDRRNPMNALRRRPFAR